MGSIAQHEGWKHFSEHNLRLDEELLKAEMWDSVEGLFPTTDAMLSGESHSNQEEHTSMAADSFEGTRKRLRSGMHDTLEVAFSDLRTKEHQHNSSTRRPSRRNGSPRDLSSDSAGEITRETRGKKDRKKSIQLPERPDPITAAKVKAGRERQRRERLNESFVELTRALDPEMSSGSLKAEKTTIIADTIKVLNNIRLENSQLQQEMRQLKDQVALVEREKQELLFQQSLMKHELEAAQAAKYTLTQHQNAGMLGVAVGVPVDMRSQRAAPGGISHLMQQEGILRPQQSQPQQLESQQPAHLKGKDPLMAASQDPFMLSSPPDFPDLDLNIGEELVAFADSHPGPALHPPIAWLPTSAPEISR